MATVPNASHVLSRKNHLNVREQDVDYSCSNNINIISDIIMHEKVTNLWHFEMIGMLQEFEFVHFHWLHLHLLDTLCLHMFYLEPVLQHLRMGKN